MRFILITPTSNERPTHPFPYGRPLEWREGGMNVSVNPPLPVRTHLHTEELVAFCPTEPKRKRAYHVQYEMMPYQYTILRT